MVTREAGHQQTSGRTAPHAPPGTPGAGGSRSTGGGGAAGALAPVLAALVGRHARVAFRFWDGSLAPPSHDATSHRADDRRHHPRPLAGRHPADRVGPGRARALPGIRGRRADDRRRHLRGPDRAPRRVPQDLRRIEPRTLVATVRAARRLGALGSPLPPPPEEARPAGRIHSPARDARAISHHYDVGNDFYELVLGPSWTYSCARFVTPATSLEEAQAAKYELICRKLGLDRAPGSRLLDVGCGWGSMALHAARHHDAQVVGIALSHEQVDKAQQRVRQAGLEDRVEIRYQDYRDLRGEEFDAISSIGMFEHVGTARTAQYFATLRDLLGPTGRLLNHAISSPGGSRLGNRTFIGRYVFPDGELIDVGEVVLAMERAGFEVRDVESLREHYSRTLRCWVANLEANWDRAVELVGRARADIWRLYMAGSAIGFDDGGSPSTRCSACCPPRRGERHAAHPG